MGDSYLYEFRVVMVGDATTGKTALVRTLVNGRFPSATEPTIGVDLFLSITKLENDVKVRLKIWDTAGQEIYRSLTKSYYRTATGVLLVYDVSNRSSFLNIAQWMRDARRYTDNASLQLVACKTDLNGESREVTEKEGMDFANAHGMKFVETSAKQLQNVKEAFKVMVETLVERVNRGEIDASACVNRHLNVTSLVNYGPIGTAKKTEGTPKKSKCSLCKVT